MYKELCKGYTVKELLQDCNVGDREILISAALIFSKILSDEKDKEFTTNPDDFVKII
jgi:hypothetical protein